MRYRCVACAPPPVGFVFWDRKGNGECPKCGRRPGRQVYPLSDTHFLVAWYKGPIAPSGASGTCCQPMSGRGLYVACERRRDRLASRIDQFSATEDPRPVTCPGCRRTKEWQDLAVLFPELAPLVAAAKEGRGVSLDLGAFHPI